MPDSDVYEVDSNLKCNFKFIFSNPTAVKWTLN